MKTMTFTKYDATGNLFLLCSSNSFLSLDKRKARFGSIARRICSPVTGAGSDGLLVIGPARDADLTLDVFNADGGWAERSGNGLRAAAAFAQKRLARKKTWKIYCGGELVTAKIVKKVTASESLIAAEVGFSEFDTGALSQMEKGSSPKLLELNLRGKRVKYLPVGIGNPHAVIPVSRFPADWVEIGRRVSENRRFPDGVNVEFVKVVNRRRLEIRIFERGVGPTGSSGTGACASVAVLNALGKVTGEVTVDSFDLRMQQQRLRVSLGKSVQPIVIQGLVKELFTMQVAL